MAMSERELGKLICALNPYTTEMDNPSGTPPVVPQAGQQGATGQAGPSTIAPGGQQGATGQAAPFDLRQFQVELDDYIANYTSGTWTFKGQPQIIKRALRVAYRYQLKDIEGKDTGIYATEHLLIGYAGGNGGG
jgi:hypothetical protein